MTRQLCLRGLLISHHFDWGILPLYSRDFTTTKLRGLQGKSCIPSHLHYNFIKVLPLIHLANTHLQLFYRDPFIFISLTLVISAVLIFSCSRWFSCQWMCYLMSQARAVLTHHSVCKCSACLSDSLS